MLPRIPLIALGAAGLLACSDSTGPSTLSLAQLAGTWRLDSLQMRLESDPTVSVNVLGQFGLSVLLTIDENGTTMLTMAMAGSAPDTVYNTIAIHGDTIAFGDYEATARLQGRTMTWLSLESTLWDLDNDGTPEDVLERDVWQRHLP